MICDSTILIIFSKLNKLDLLLKIFDNLLIPEAVYNEVVEKGINNPDSFLIKELVEKKQIIIKALELKWKNKSEFLRETYKLGNGESEAISLSLQEKKFLLIDDKLARKIARLYEVKTQGSLRVLLLAFKSKLLTENEIKKILVEMTLNNNFRLSAGIISKFWILFDKLKGKK